MTKLKFLAIIAIASAVTITPALAQPAISEPGAYAFYHPDADLGIGSAPSPREAAGSTRGQIAMTFAPLRNGGTHAYRNQEARNRGVGRATARARTNDNGVPQAYGIEGRQVAAPPWSAACMTDHGPSECGEPMWVYGSHEAIAGYRNAF